MAGERVLIVEDRRENIVHLANNVLKPNGYQILTAMDGQRGLGRILNDRPDLVIMDLNMPKMDGLEVLAALQERQVDVPVILTTFYGSEQVAEQALRLGAAAYVVKPYEPDDMLQAIKRALARRPSPPPPPQPEETMPLTRQVERWMRDMNILTRIGKALVAQLTLESVCTRTIEAAIYITRADHAFLFLTDDAGETRPCLCALRGPGDPRVRLLNEPVDSALPAHVLRSGKVLVRASAAGETALVELVGGLLGPMAAAPLRWQGKSLGALLATRRPGGAPFGESDVEWLVGLSDYAAIAVRNVRAWQSREGAAPPPARDEAKLVSMRGELQRLAEDLQAIAEVVQQLAGQLTPGDDTEAEPPEAEPAGGRSAKDAAGHKRKQEHD